MSSLFSALRSTADTLSAFQRGLTVSQNNVANASTPGYARQTQSLTSRSFDPSVPTTGGVRAGELISSRNEYLEAAVRRSIQDYNRWSQQADSLSPMQDVIDIGATGGVSNALDDLYASFSSWSTTPNDDTARQNVLSKAGSLAAAFRSADASLSTASADADNQMKSLVARIDTLTKTLRDLNVSRTDTNLDPGADASFHATLEELSEIADVQAYRQSDGSWTVLLGGETPLVVGEFQYDVSVSSDASAAVVRDAAGRDITDQIGSGKLGALLDVRNRVVAGLRSGLNSLAESVATQVNDILTAGRVSDGPPEVGGVALFTFSDSGGAAATLAVNPDITASQLAAISPGPPYVSNGTALALAKLASTSSIDGSTFSAYYASLAASLGNEVSTAETHRSIQEDSLSQAQELRQQASGVSLDEEAIKVLEFQKAYQAASKMISVLSELTDTVINMVN
jgi:flagellar hook-associated protein 1 FlgK